MVLSANAHQLGWILEGVSIHSVLELKLTSPKEMLLSGGFKRIFILSGLNFLFKMGCVE